MNNRKLFIFAGPIGAGKTTVYNALRGSFNFDSSDYICTDCIADSIKSHSEEDFSVCYEKAKGVVSYELEKARKEGKNIIWETVLTKENKFIELKKFIEQGYYVSVFFVAVKDVEICLKRVSSRQSLRCYTIPEEKVRKRFVESNDKLEYIETLVDELWIIDNSKNQEDLNSNEMRITKLKKEK